MASSSVVITGTSTGIGRATALELDRAGFTVFAGVRREEDGAALRREGSERLHPMLLDVTDVASIEYAEKTVSAQVGEAGLAGLVNNAGIGVDGPIEFMPAEDISRQFEVNVFGPVAVARAFLPLLRTSRGRIVNVSSVAGRMSSPLIGVYCASKFALEAISDALRMELSNAGIRVVIVEPGFVETAMLDKGKSELDRVIEALPPRGRELYEAPLRTFEKSVESFRKRACNAEDVARTIHRALITPRPRARYAVGTDARVLLLMRRWLPSRANDWIGRRLTGL